MAAVVMALVLIAAIALSNALNPVGTAWFALRAARRWRRHWPFPTSGDLPQRIIGLLVDVGIFRPVRMRVDSGFLMELDPRDWVTNQILMDGVWESRISRVVLEELWEGAVFVDVGAHVGYFSLFASTLVGPMGRVVAIEPSRPAAERLRRNIVVSGLRTL